MLRPHQLRIAIQALGGPSAASRRLGCSDSLVHHWLTGRRLISAEKALRLRDLMIALSGTLPGVAYDLKVAAQQAEMRQMQWRARRPRWQPARGDKPRPSPLERSERRRQQREIFRRVAAGEPIAAPAEEYGAQPQTIVRWARRSSSRQAGRGNVLSALVGGTGPIPVAPAKFLANETTVNGEIGSPAEMAEIRESNGVPAHVRTK